MASSPTKGNEHRAVPLNSYRRQFRERRITALLYWSALGLLMILLFGTWRYLYTAAERNDQVRKHNYIVIELDALFGLMRDQETGLRGYLLTRDREYLMPFIDADPNYSEHMGRLDSLFKDHPDRGLDSLTIAAYDLRLQWRQLLTRVDANPTLGVEEVRDRLNTTKATMDRARRLFTRLMVDTRRTRDSLLATERERGFDAPSMVVIYAGLALAASALLFWRLSRALHRTERMKLALDLKVRDLDREVKERSSLQDMLQNVLDTSPGGIMAFRAVRDRDGDIIDFEWISSNERADVLLKREDLVGRFLLIEMPEERTCGLFDGYVNVVTTGQPLVIELERSERGASRWFSYHAVKLEDGFVVTFGDTTEQRRAQEVNNEADRVALTAQITRTIAHEVRNPLTNIHLAVEQVQEEVADRKEEAAPFFAIIERNLRRIGTLVKQMLESSSIRELHPAPCRMQDIAAKVMDAVDDRLRLKGMQGAVDVAADLPEVLADAELIDLAITNIAVNAIEAMEPGKGELWLVAARDADDVILEIIDNGKGIPPVNIPRLFEPFYSGRPGGLGLGLTTARTILGHHKIKLDVRSTVGKGTRFTLRFPEEILV